VTYLTKRKSIYEIRKNDNGIMNNLTSTRIEDVQAKKDISANLKKQSRLCDIGI